jgi:hypothetical protein
VLEYLLLVCPPCPKLQVNRCNASNTAVAAGGRHKAKRMGTHLLRVLEAEAILGHAGGAVVSSSEAPVTDHRRHPSSVTLLRPSGWEMG